MDLGDYQARLRDGLLNIALKFGAGVDKNGKPYEWMIESRELLLGGPYLHMAARLLWERIRSLDAQVVGGMTVAANPLTIAMMYESRAQGHPLDAVIIRREAKVDGLRKIVEGPNLERGTRLVLLDDLINSGETQRAALKALAPFEVDVVAIGVVVDYERHGSKRLRDDGYRVESLFTFSDLGMALTPPTEPSLASVAWTWGPLNSTRSAMPKSIPQVFDDRIVVGSDNGFLVALSLEGTELWRFKVRDTHRGIHGTACRWGSHLFIGAYDGYLYSLDLVSGRQEWACRPGQWIGSSPVVSEAGVVYVGVEAGECSGYLSAVDGRSGEVLWDMPTRDYIHSSPVLDSARGQVLVGSNDASLYSVDATSGRKRWECPTQGDVKGAPALATDGSIYVASFDGHLYSVEGERGKIRWKKRLGRQLYATPLVFDDLVIVGSYTSRVVALERDSGRTVWVATTGGRVVGGAARVDASTIAVGSADGCVYLLDARTGRTRWSHRTGAQIMGTPGVGAGLVLVPSFDGLLHAFRVQPRL